MSTTTVSTMETITPSISTRITSSATGLAKQILYAPEGTTCTFANLRATNKGPVFCDGAVERYPKALSVRRRNGKIGPPTSARSPETYSEGEFEEEFYGGGWGSASSSRAVSPLEVEERVDLERNDGFDTAWNHASETDTTDTSPAVSFGIELVEEFWSSGFEGGAQLWDQRRLSQDQRNKCWNLGASTPDLRELTRTGTGESRLEDGERQKVKALERLRLLYSHLPAIHAAETLATTVSENLEVSHLTTSNTAEDAAVDHQDKESTFNQFCLSEDALAWYEAGMSIGRIGQRTDWEHGLDSAEATRMEGEVGVLETSMREMPAVTRQRFVASLRDCVQGSLLQGSRELQEEKQQEQEQEQETLPEFHCPWIECHRRFRISNEYIRDTKDAVDGDGLPCVHVGCERKFEDEGTWRRHVFVAHHDLLPLRLEGGVDMEGVWERNMV